MSAKVYEAINDQVNNELSASHSYLAMSGVCEELNYPGAAHWFRVQSEEERGHALRLFDFIHARSHHSHVSPERRV
jgi:ferritin